MKWLFIALFCEGLSLMLFSQMRTLCAGRPALIAVRPVRADGGGATFAVVPFINKRALGSVAGIVGAGGNAGAVAAGFLFKSEGLLWPTALFILGAVVTAASFSSFAITFHPATERELEPRAPFRTGMPQADCPQRAVRTVRRSQAMNLPDRATLDQFIRPTRKTVVVVGNGMVGRGSAKSWSSSTRPASSASSRSAKSRGRRTTASA